jgi:tetratricopeptide (TPR) repeat protein
MNPVEWWQDKRYTNERRIVFATAGVLLLLPPLFYLLSFFRTPEIVPTRATVQAPAVAEPPAPPAKSVIEQATEMVASGQLDAAEKFLDAEEVGFWRLRGAIAWQRNQLPEALRFFQAAAAAAPDSAIDLGNLAQIQLLLGDAAGAVTSLRAAQAADPRDEFVANRLYLARIQAGESEAVAVEVDRLLQAAPGSSLPTTAMAAAAVALQRGNPGEAAKFLRAGRSCLPPEIFESLLLETPLASHASDPEVAPFYLKNVAEKGP